MSQAHFRLVELVLFRGRERSNVNFRLSFWVREETTENVWVSVQIAIEVFCANLGRNFEACGLPSFLCEFGGFVNVVWPMSEINVVMLAKPFGFANI